TKLQITVFNLYFWSYFLPRVLLGQVLRLRLDLVKVIMLAVWTGFLQSQKRKKTVLADKKEMSEFRGV
ncbi:MAG: hypothetical protein ACYCV0_17715, partial [Desulfitobacteriaceae bacterium]